jgi:hypothetical protein
VLGVPLITVPDKHISPHPVDGFIERLFEGCLVVLGDNVLQLHFVETLICVRLQGKVLLQSGARFVLYGHSQQPSCDGDFYIFRCFFC